MAVFSKRINDPAFARYVQDSNRWALIFAAVLAVAAIAGFFLAGQLSWSDLENPEALFIGLGIGAMFLVIALVQIRNRNRSTTWDGEVVDKRIEEIRRRQKRQDNRLRWQVVRRYWVIVRSDSGTVHRIMSDGDRTVYDYYAVGDRVRHHGGINTYEKCDKSKDSIIFCNACGTLHDISAEYCTRCHCPLLK
jgi:hypothetical protein